MASSTGGSHAAGGADSAVDLQQLLSAESLEKIYKFTRFPRDKEAVLKPSLGLPVS